MADRYDQREHIALPRGDDRPFAAIIPKKGRTETYNEAKTGSLYPRVKDEMRGKGRMK